MSGVWGNKVKYSIFGESHGKGIGINIDGLPSGIKLDLDAIILEMKRRAPGQDDISTTRSEKDEFQIHCAPPMVKAGRTLQADWF